MKSGLTTTFPRIFLGLLLFCPSLVLGRMPAQNTLDIDVFAKVSSNVFEVIVKKNALDPLVYESPLPLELLPFSERNDPYLSVGTAFALKDGTFVSAAHVFSLIEPSFRTEWALRDAEGKVWPLGNVVEYSQWRDYIVFKVPGLEVPGLEKAPVATANTKVFAVGNALGQGVIYRDGLLTSFTSEDWTGAWKWLRFSAPASPGNSGGPLIDTNGRVLGIILQKSENENLNYALPLAEIGKNSTAYLDLRFTYQLPLFPRQSIIEIHDSFPLPQTINKLAESLIKRLDVEYAMAARNIVTEKSEGMFPQAPESRNLLGDSKASSIPTFVRQESNGLWSLDEPGELRGAPLDGGKGYLVSGEKYGYQFFNISHAEKNKEEALVQNGKKLADLFLQGYFSARKIGSKQIRIISLGEPSSQETLTDRWGRMWFTYRFYFPAIDYAFLLTATAHPDGAYVILKQERYGVINVYEKDLQVMIDYCNLAYQGTSDAWKTFLSRTAIIPEEMKTWHVEQVGSDGLGLSVSGINMQLFKNEFPLDPSLRLTVYPAFFAEKDSYTWRTARFFLDYAEKDRTMLSIHRADRPDASLAEEDKSWYESIARRNYPYDGTLLNNNDGSSIAILSLLPPSWSSMASTYQYYLKIQKGKEKGFENLAKLTSDISKKIKLDASELQGTQGLKRTPKLDKGTRVLGMDAFYLIEQNIASLISFVFLNLPYEGLFDLSSRDELGESTLIKAIKIPNPTWLDALVKRGASPDQFDANGTSALELAITTLYGRYKGEPTIDSNIHTLARKSTKPGKGLRLALEQSFDDLALVFLANGALQYESKAAKGELLYLALKNKNLLSVNYLLKQEPELAQWQNTKSSETLLHTAAWNMPQSLPDLLELKSPGNLDAKDPDGNTALALALRRGSLEGSEQLIEKGAKLENAMVDGWNPLGLALRSGNSRLVDLVLEKGGKSAWLTQRSKGWTALMLAARYNHHSLDSLLRHFGSPSKANPDVLGLEVKNPAGFTALHLAVLGGRVETVQWLLDQGAQKNTLTSQGKTALELAREKKNKALVELLD